MERYYFNTSFDDKNVSYLLKLKGLLNNKYILVDTNEKELLAVEFDFQWNKLHYDYNMMTSDTFDALENKELLLLTTLHCINYYLTFMNGVGAL